MKISAKVNIGSQLGGGGSATLERTSFTTGQAVQQTSKARLADGGGGGNKGGGIKTEVMVIYIISMCIQIIDLN